MIATCLLLLLLLLLLARRYLSLPSPALLLFLRFTVSGTLLASVASSVAADLQRADLR
jgi:hypothetical protein